nr:DUF6193 family natural product biosynthesis protein [Streptomyces sp. NBC_01142]
MTCDRSRGHRGCGMAGCPRLRRRSDRPCRAPHCCTAYAHPPLRELFPMVSHGVLYLSRCTKYPWTHDVGTAFPEVAGGYRVLRQSGNTPSAWQRPWRRHTT